MKRAPRASQVHVHARPAYPAIYPSSSHGGFSLTIPRKIAKVKAHIADGVRGCVAHACGCEIVRLMNGWPGVVGDARKQKLNSRKLENEARSADLPLLAPPLPSSSIASFRQVVAPKPKISGTPQKYDLEHLHVSYNLAGTPSSKSLKGVHC